MIIQLCGMSGAGKTTIANGAAKHLINYGIRAYVLDGDIYRQNLCKDLGFGKEDRAENIRRMAFVADQFSQLGIVAILAAINPYEHVRQQLSKRYQNVKVAYVECPIAELISRDSKGLYRRALLPTDDPNFLPNFTGISSEFEIPENPHLTINTASDDPDRSIAMLVNFIVTLMK